MILEKNWRILTIGDGDLSFSNALKAHHQPLNLTASVYDSLSTMSDKYGDSFYQQLIAQDTQVLFSFDVTNPQTWQNLPKHSFDVVIFQFPLMPGFSSLEEYKTRCAQVNINTLNRRLLRDFLLNSFAHFLDPLGQQLCFITSKDVKPYIQWNIENALHMNTDIHYLGSHPFDITQFPGYKVRNVDRDKHVKDTKGITYMWSQQAAHPISDKLTPASHQQDSCCKACRAGPFITNADREKHNRTVKHKQMMELEALWLSDLQRHQGA